MARAFCAPVRTGCPDPCVTAQSAIISLCPRHSFPAGMAGISYQAGRQTSPVPSMAQIARAMRFASATAATLAGFVARIRPSQSLFPSLSPRRDHAHRAETEKTPQGAIARLRDGAHAMFAATGIGLGRQSHAQADRSRDVRKALVSAICATIALAVIGPIPGIVWSRRACSFLSAASRICRVISAMRA